MAHFAKIIDGTVVDVIVAETQEWCEENLSGTWVQTSFNGNIRFNYAGIGYSYDSVRDAFIPPKPFDSWVLNEDTCNWDAPIPYPTDGIMYMWDEETTDWKAIVND